MTGMVIAIPLLAVGPPSATANDCQPAQEMSSDALQCVEDRVDPLTWLPFAATTGISCSGKTFKLADWVEGANFNAWVLVEEPDLVQQVEELAFSRAREVIIGWNWQTPMSRNGITLTWVKEEHDASGRVDVSGPYSHTGKADTTMCGGVREYANVGGLSGRTTTILPVWTFSGAQETIVDTNQVIGEFTLSLSTDFKWYIGITTKGFGGISQTISFGASATYTFTEGTSVSVTSISKSVVGHATVTSGPTLPKARFDGVATDALGPGLCVAWHNDIDGCMPLDFQ